MNSRQRVLAALNHRQPDAVPVDFGSTAVTGMHVTCVAALRDRYGLDRRPVKVHEPYQMLGLIEDDLLEAIGVDVVSLPAPRTIFGFANEMWRPWRTPWGQEVLVSDHFKTIDANGDTLIYPQGDTAAPPSGRMPRSGWFFDTIIRQQPIDEDQLDPDDNLEEFGPLSDDDLAFARRQGDRLASSSRAVVSSIGGMPLGDIALVPAPFLTHPKGIRDIAEWYISTSARRDYVERIFAAQCDMALANLQKLHPVLGDAIDVLVVCGTDFGTQSSTFCSEETYRTLYLPYYKQFNDWVHSHTKWKTFKHSCGSVVRFMDAFIDSGFDILNPVQCSAAGMEPGMLKLKYGDRITFWGGGIDTQKVLPFGTPAEVRQQVLDRCEIFAQGGGFVFNAIHNVQANTPVENVMVMIEAVKEFNGQ